jgi:Gpi18-like mannosyltransferase
MWPLLLGVIYHVTYNLAPNLFFYNFALKIPVIAANIGLAFATKTIMQRLNMPPRTVRFAWLFLLFNPFTLLTTAAWGQFDTLIALLVVVSIYFLSKGQTVESGLLLSISVVLKPIAFPLLGLPLLFSSKNPRSKFVYVLILVFTVLALWILPFNILGWAPPASINETASFFRMAGGMTLFNILEVTQNTAILPANLAFLGYLWIPALLIAYYFLYRNPPKNTRQLVGSAVVLLFVAFLSRTWLSEPNVNVLLPLILMLVGFGAIGRRSFHLLWIIPFVFLFFNYAFPQLFFLVYPPIVPAIAAFDLQIGIARLLGRFILTIVWYAIALRTLFSLLSKRQN